ncbi:polyketide synthase 12/myxalamid-type polyketide synthase MxaF [Stigmatella erecta]|uniref:Polyketide synthase 12/myxalamid-type polyketide synthase MxaF n=1 Tax=Stigmatella erecta TaxID=83460 RepID=A0A1I0KTP8_9BACT|nr:polyketide synthase 12/myxalamid-type polyketide synthase MxaF [Stigmatella erecta]
MSAKDKVQKDALVEVQARLVGVLAQRLGLDARKIDVRERFSRYGLDSLKATGFIAELGAMLGRSLSPTLTWEYPTPDSLARHLAGEQEGPSLQPVTRVARQDEPIAIVGLSCRFPQAPDPEAFWRLLAGGTDAITEVPADRWDVNRLYDRDATAAGKVTSRWGGYLDRVDGFDPLFFGISPKEALHMDPQQRLMLELTWEALEDAGIAADRLQGSPTAVCFGVIWTDYETLLQRLGLRRISPHTASGFHHSIVANRVSYVLGLRGPSMAIDTACSSSLSAVHLACESLRRGESTLAIVGGVNLNIAPDSTVSLSKLGALSPDGRCYTFDARANGYVRGEGAGVAVLKPLSQAISDGDPIYCVIRGSAINNNGGSNGLTAPNPQAQADVLRQAYARAGVEPADVQYVEAHGTGTQLGDPLEARALGEVLGAGRPAEKPLYIGSCKTNVGHLEAAAGITGLIKVALSIKNRALPPSLHFETPNPLIPFGDLRLEVQSTLSDWPEPDRKLIGGVSSFGFGGTNCHVVLEEPNAPRAELVHLSGGDAEALRAAAQRLLDRVDSVEHVPLAELLREAAAEDGGHAHRLAMTIRSRKELRECLKSFLAGEARAGVTTGKVESGHPQKPVFVFSGHGSQWPRMGLALARTEPVFRASLAQCDRLIQENVGWSLLAMLGADDAAAQLGRIDVTLPAIVALEIALTELWRSWGIEPAAVVGHSIGEVSAAYAAGILGLEDTLRVVCTQSRMMARLRGQGAMGLVGISWEQSAELLAGYEGRLCRAIDAGAGSTVLSGEPAALDEVFATLQPRGVFCRRVDIDVAVHSPQIDVLRDELSEALREIRPGQARIPMISTVNASVLAGGNADASHWVNNIAMPTLFTRALSHTLGEGHRVFLEVGPHAILKHSMESTLRHTGQQGLIVPSMRRQEDERGTMLDTLGALYVRGQQVQWEAISTGGVGGGARPASGEEPVRLLPLSARSPEALKSLAEACRDFLDDGAAQGAALEDITYTAGVRRSHHSHRLSVVGSSRREIAEALEAFARGEVRPGVSQGRVSLEGRAKVAFVFPGQGSQWLGMGRQLLSEEPVFRAKIEACEQAMRAHVDWSLTAELCADEQHSRLQEIDVVQPVLFAMQVALAALWRSWGIAPDAVVGHSMGEVAAAHVAGALSLEDAVRIICLRSLLLRRMSGQGAMAVVELGLEQAREVLAGYETRLSIGVSNSARSTVLSGDTGALEEVLARLEGQGVFCRRVKVNVASHSPQMDPLKDDLLRVLEGISPVSAAVPIYSTVTGQTSDGGDFYPSYWVSNLREPVLFHGAVERLLEDGYSVLLEVSPHPVLLAPIEETLRESKRDGLVLASLRRQAQERRSLLESLAALYAWGCSVDWTPLHPSGGRVVALPKYPWQRERFWLMDEAEADPQQASAAREGRAGHPFLGSSLSSSLQPGTHFWERAVSTEAFPYLSDHCVWGEAVFPGAGYVEMALCAGAEVLGEAGLVLENVSISEMLALKPGAARRVQMVLSEEGAGRASFQISSRAEGDNTWRKHAAGTLRREESANLELSAEPPELLRERLDVEISSEAHYRSRQEQGLMYGPAFQALRQLWRSEREGLGRLELSAEVSSESGEYRLHPALLDASLQVAVELIAPMGGKTAKAATYVPVGLGRIRLFQRPGRAAWVWVKALGEGAASERERSFDVRLLDDQGHVLMELEELRLYRLEAGAAVRKELGEWIYQVDWEAQPLAAELPWPARPPGSWLIFSDSGGVGQRLSALLRARGETCVLVSPAEKYRLLGPGSAEVDPRNADHLRRLLGDTLGTGAPPCRGVVHLWSLDCASNDALTPPALEASRRLGSTSVLHLVQALSRAGWRDAPRLWLTTRGARSVGKEPERVNVAQAPLWGLGQVLALEQPELSCTRVDLEGSAEACAEALLKELSSKAFEDQIAWRGGKRHVARLSRAADMLAARDPAAILRADGTYLITGGLGGLGLEVARWLVSHGARHLLLLGRRPPSAEAEHTLSELRQAGAQVEPFQADVASPDDVARALARVGESMPPLRGVVHAAGLLEDGLLLNLTEERFASVMAPKVLGTWNLHTQTRHLPLDLFVLFSSVAASLGTPGQANYSAANAFMDALAHARRAEGLPALSINWGTWTSVGLAAAQANRGERLEARGLRGMAPDKALMALGMLLGQGRPQVSVMSFEPRQWLGFYLAAAQSPFFTRLAQEQAGKPSVAPGRSRIREQLEAARGSERRALFDQHLRELIGGVLRMDPARIEPRVPLGSLGLDSLMSMEIRNRLEAALGLKLSATVVWTYPTLAALTPYLAEKMELPLEDKGSELRIAAVPAPAPLSVAPGSEIDEMSEEEVERLFAQKVAQGK